MDDVSSSMSAPEKVRRRAHEAAARQDWATAEECAKKYMEMAGEARAELVLLARAWREQRNHDMAIPLLQRLLETAEPQEVVQICDILSSAFIGKARMADAATVLERALAVEPNAILMERLANILAGMGRDSQAAELAARALILDPDRTSARALLQTSAKFQGVTKRFSLAKLPKRLGLFADAKQVIRSSLLQGYPQGERFIDESTRFVTLGSCFASNLATYLSARGLNAFSENIGEDVNSTYANRYLLDWVQNGVSSKPSQIMQEAYGEGLRERMRAALKQCDVFVFSLGVAPCFFDNETGEFFFVNTKSAGSLNLLFNHCRMRTTTVRENVDNLNAIIETVNQLAVRPPTIVLTVSPVPLNATSERSSAFIADCISKSTLRLACEEVISSRPGEPIHYWPSFEVVRWLGPYLSAHHPPVFGAEDDKTRHVSNWVVSAIMDLFVETYWSTAISSVPADEAKT